MILAHPQLSHLQALEIARRDRLIIMQTKHNNFRYEPSNGLNVHVSSVSPSISGSRPYGRERASNSALTAGVTDRRDGQPFESSAAPGPSPTVLLPVPEAVGGAAAGPLEAA